MVDIRDVAKHAGVSVSTVSNVLNGRVNQMRKETLTRIQNSMMTLNYQPNRVAQQLKTGQTKMLGLLVPSIVNPSFAALVHEIETVAKNKYGYQVLLGNTYRQEAQEKQFLNDLLSLGIRGVIVASTSIGKSHFTAAAKNGLVMVNYDGWTLPQKDSDEILIDSVAMDNFQAGRIAAQHLIQQGCRNIVFATEQGKTISRLNKIAGFLSVIEETGLSTEERIIEGKANFAYGDSEMAELGKNLAEKVSKMTVMPDGIVAINDMLAIGMIAGFHAKGINVPEDISIVGMDNMFLATLFTPALTSVAPPLASMASMMVDRLIARLGDASISTEEFLFTPSLIQRESVIKRI